MSILIKGVEMPPNCFLCKLSFMSGERLFCSAMKNEEVLRSKIDSNCPLIELPPHGRLIDADAILGKINAIISAHPDEADLYEQDAVIVRDWLRSEPTIIEAEGESDG